MTRPPPRLVPPPSPDFVIDYTHDPCHERWQRQKLRIAIGCFLVVGIAALAWGLS